LPSWRRAVALADEANRTSDRLQVAATLARLQQHALATAEAGPLAEPTSATGATLYDAACVYALSSAAVARDPQIPQVERSRQAEEYTRKALALLERARRAGYFQEADAVEGLKKDPDLQALHARQEFQELLASLERKMHQ
jgi:hypothetical protein